MEKVSYASLSKMEKENSKLTYVDDFDDIPWPSREGNNAEVLNQKVLYPYPLDSKDFMDGGYGTSEDHYAPVSRNGPPEVNLKTVMSGILTILTGLNKDRSSLLQLPSTNVSFLGSAKDGETVLHASVYTPSAPPLFEPNAFNYNAYKDVHEAEPPEWLPDSSATVCMQCRAPFTALTRGRHHCCFVEASFVGCVQKEGLYYLLSLGRGIHRGCVTLATIGLIHCKL